MRTIATTVTAFALAAGIALTGSGVALADTDSNSHNRDDHRSSTSDDHRSCAGAHAINVLSCSDVLSGILSPVNS